MRIILAIHSSSGQTKLVVSLVRENLEAVSFKHGAVSLYAPISRERVVVKARLFVQGLYFVSALGTDRKSSFKCPFDFPVYLANAN